MQGNDEVAFEIGAIAGPQLLLTYSAVLDVLKIVSLKVQDQGYHGWYGDILIPETREYIGLFLLGKKHAYSYH